MFLKTGFLFGSASFSQIKLRTSTLSPKKANFKPFSQITFKGEIYLGKSEEFLPDEEIILFWGRHVARTQWSKNTKRQNILNKRKGLELYDLQINTATYSPAIQLSIILRELIG